MSEEVYVPPIRRIQEAVAATCGIAVAELLGARRVERYVDARHLSIALCADRLPALSVSAIARSHRLDHTTVLAALERWPARRRQRPYLEALERDLRARLSAAEGTSAATCPHCGGGLFVGLVPRARA